MQSEPGVRTSKVTYSASRRGGNKQAAMADNKHHRQLFGAGWWEETPRGMTPET